MTESNQAPEYPHLIDGEFQSDKYPTTPRGFVPLKCSDPSAQPVLWEYAQYHAIKDPQFSDDLLIALKNKGYEHAETDFSKSVRLTIRLCDEINRGRTDSDLADWIRDELDGPWSRLRPDQQKTIKELSAGLGRDKL